MFSRVLSVFADKTLLIDKCVFVSEQLLPMFPLWDFWELWMESKLSNLCKCLLFYSIV